MTLSRHREFLTLILILALNVGSIIAAPEQGNAAPAPVFAVQIATSPDSVEVFLDDSAKGLSPCAIPSVPAGSHTLTLKKNGYYLKKAAFTVDSASPKRLEFTLLKPAALQVSTLPPGAVFLLDGRPVGFTPALSDKIRPGEHSIAVRSNGYNPVEQTVTLKSGQCDTVRLTLVHSTAWHDSVALADKKSQERSREKLAMAVLGGVFVLLAAVLLMFQTGK